MARESECMDDTWITYGNRKCPDSLWKVSGHLSGQVIYRAKVQSVALKLPLLVETT